METPVGTGSARIALTVEVERDSVPISGRVRSSERAREFEGWIGLVAALEALLAPDSDPPHSAERLG